MLRDRHYFEIGTRIGECATKGWNAARWPPVFRIHRCDRYHDLHQSEDRSSQALNIFPKTKYIAPTTRTTVIFPPTSLIFDVSMLYAPKTSIAVAIAVQISFRRA